MKMSILYIFGIALVASFALSSCTALKEYSNKASDEVSQLELPPNVASNKLSKKRSKN